MPDAPAFPNPDSFCLHQADGQPVRLAQVRQHLRGGFVLISCPDGGVASGRRMVPLAELDGAAPLTAEERAEYRALRDRLTGQSKPRRAKADRFEELHRRIERADLLERLLGELAKRDAAQPREGRAA